MISSKDSGIIRIRFDIFPLSGIYLVAPNLYITLIYSNVSRTASDFVMAPVACKTQAPKEDVLMPFTIKLCSHHMLSQPSKGAISLAFEGYLRLNWVPPVQLPLATLMTNVILRAFDGIVCRPDPPSKMVVS